MTNPKVAIRLGVDGQAEVKRGFADMRRDGEQAFAGVASAAEAAAERQARAWANQANAAKLAVAANRSQSSFNALLGVGGSGAGSAAASAAVFEEAARAEAQLEQRARALKAAIDPAWAAQDRFNAEMREAKTLLDAGRISTDQYMAAAMRAKSALDQSSASLQRHGNMTGQQRAMYQQLGYQVQDISMQLATGINPLIVLAQQGGQTASALAGAGGVAGRVASFFAGPWGAALLAGAAGVGLLWQNLDKAKSSSDALAASQSSLATFFDMATGRIKEQNQALIQNRLIVARDDEAAARADLGSARWKIRTYGATDRDLIRAQQQFQRDNDVNAFATRLAAAQEGKPQAYRDQAEVLLRLAGSYATNEAAAKRLAAEQRLLKGSATEADKALLGFSQTTDRAGDIMRAVAARTNDAAGASARHAIEIDRLKKKFAEDKDEKAFADGVAAANAALAANKDGLKASTAALRDERRELKEYLRDLESLVQRYDQVGSATKRYREDMALLSRGVADGKIDPEQAATIRRAGDRGDDPRFGDEAGRDDRGRGHRDRQGRRAAGEPRRADALPRGSGSALRNAEADGRAGDRRAARPAELARLEGDGLFGDRRRRQRADAAGDLQPAEEHPVRRQRVAVGGRERARRAAARHRRLHPFGGDAGGAGLRRADQHRQQRLRHRQLAGRADVDRRARPRARRAAEGARG